MRTSFPLHRPARLAALGLLALATSLGQAAVKADTPKDDFMPYVQLAPFVVNGERLAISIHARTKKDRRYAEVFAEEVVKVVTEAVTPETGKGLVIIGKKGEPHPSLVFRKFLALAEEGKLDPAVAARAPELSGMLNHWQDGIGGGKTVNVTRDDGDTDLEFDKIVTALPLPLEGIGAKLYQLAWLDGFADAKVEARLLALRAADLDGNLLARFDWVFYLPPRGALEQVIDEIIAEALKQEDIGFLTRTLVKGALLMVKPTIRKAIEGVRQGVMFETVVHARTPYGPTEVSALTGAYIDALMPEDKPASGSEHERAVRAVRERVQELATKIPPATDATATTPPADPRQDSTLSEANQ